MAVHRLWVVFICLSGLFLSIGKYFLEVMFLLLFELVFLLVSSLRVASVWRKEIEGRNQVQFPLLYS